MRSAGRPEACQNYCETGGNGSGNSRNYLFRKILDHKANNFLCAIHFGDKIHGVAFIDASTGEFFTGQGNLEYIDKLIQNFAPSEIVFQRNRAKDFYNQYGKKYYTYHIDDWVFQMDYARETLLRQLETTSLKGFGVDELHEAIIAAGAVLYYLSQNQNDRLQHISSISRIEEERYVWLDRFTIRNLELIYSPHDKAKTLIEIIDKTISPMGARLLRRWIVLPLKDLKPIEERQEMVQWLLHNSEKCQIIQQQLKQIGDLERLVSKVAIRKISPREVMHLKKSLQAIQPIKLICESGNQENLMMLAEQLNLCSVIVQKIENTIVADAPALISKGNAIKDNINADLDYLRNISRSGKNALAEIQKMESERTGIPSLKVGFNNVFGYYIEVTNTHKNKVPPEWIRKQTLSNAERYITPELKKYEEEILGADEKILTLEEKIFNDLITDVAEYIKPGQTNASVLAKIDCMQSFATVAEQNNYVKPHLNETNILNIKDGRHPVLEQQMPLGESYVANDIYLDDNSQQIIIITGPNMSGKSALLRQTALIVLLAQTGTLYRKVLKSV